jgi:hypothetical protein
MGFFFNSVASYRAAGKTQSANTVIDVVIPPYSGYRTALTYLAYSLGSTAHTITVMRPLGHTTLSTAAAAAQAVINLTADPGTPASSMLASPYGEIPAAVNAIAANDYLVIKNPTTGIYNLYVVSSVATLAITLTANVPTGGFNIGQDVWFFGVAADTEQALWNLTPTVSVRNTYSSGGKPLFVTPDINQPLILHSTNGTAAGTFDLVTADYVGRT